MWQLTKKRNIFYSWIEWHYVIALRELFIISKNSFLFTFYYFSIPFLTRTLFYPWKKQKIYKEKGFDIASFFDALVFNLFSRFIGALIRISVIITGLLAQMLTSLVIFLVFVFWIFLPVAVLLSFPIYIWLILT
jgi:hypothetical protein